MPPAPFHFDRSRLDPVLEPIVRAHGAEVMDVEFKSEQGGWILRVFVEKLGSADRNASTKEAAVDLNTCASIARDLSPALDVVDFVSHRYHLEVSTPGVERALRGERDFRRFKGEKAKVKLERAVQGQKVVIGIIGEVGNGKCCVIDGSRNYEFDLADVSSARLVFEFGPPSKPGGKKGAPTSKRAQQLQHNFPRSPDSQRNTQSSTTTEPPPSSKRDPR